MSKRTKAFAWIDNCLVCGLIAACCGCSQTESNPKSGSQDTPTVSVETNAATIEASQPAAKPDFYTVDHYDVTRNPADDLTTTIERAKSEKKNILIQVGGDWCGWCKLMSTFIETDEKVRDNILSNYVVMKVTENGDKTNASFLSQYPSIPGYPHLFVLDSDGKLLHSQGTAELEEGRGYNETVYLEFLNKWKPAR
jgi:thiol:disulfide interchange protein